MEFSKRLDLFGDEIFAALNERKVALEAQGRTIYNLSVGTPDFAPAEHIRKAMMDAAADPQNWKYSLRDLPELLDAVCGYYKRRFGVKPSEIDLNRMILSKKAFHANVVYPVRQNTA